MSTMDPKDRALHPMAGTSSTGDDHRSAFAEVVVESPAPRGQAFNSGADELSDDEAEAFFFV